MSYDKNDPYAWSRSELAAYKSRENRNTDRQIMERNLRAAGMSEKNIRSLMQGVTDRRKGK